MAAFAAILAAMSAAPAHAADETSCSGSYQGDKMAAKAYTSRSTHIIGGVGAGIDSYVLGVPITCDVSNSEDADNIVDTYLQGTIYAYDSNARAYTYCMGLTPGWRGYWSTANQYWSTDMDLNPANFCGWKTKPIKVRTIAKGQWKDGTIKTATTYVTDSAL
ncbi:hypothetical protein [Marmoricola sp. RAF53]|uniref:hypothetical protein n=1 Tax=Marmoricola sp. RAF53 TaxID=3233059 RepID=UPI003F9704DF